MRTKISKKYSYQLFPREKLYQLHLELEKYLKTSPSDSNITIQIKQDGFKVDRAATKEDIEGEDWIDLSFHYGSLHHMYFYLDKLSKTLEISYLIYDSLEAAKNFINCVEQALDLKLWEEINELSDVLSVWERVSKKLRSLYSEASYATWISPIISSRENNDLVLNCPNDFFKDWILSRYIKDITEVVQSIDPSVEEVIVKVGDKEDNLTDKAIIKRKLLEIDEPLFELMKQVYERETENPMGSFDKYFSQVIRSHCQERM